MDNEIPTIDFEEGERAFIRVDNSAVMCTVVGDIDYDYDIEFNGDNGTWVYLIKTDDGEEIIQPAKQIYKTGFEAVEGTFEDIIDEVKFSEPSPKKPKAKVDTGKKKIKSNNDWMVKIDPTNLDNFKNNPLDLGGSDYKSFSSGYLSSFKPTFYMENWKGYGKPNDDQERLYLDDFMKDELDFYNLVGKFVYFPRGAHNLKANKAYKIVEASTAPALKSNWYIVVLDEQLDPVNVSCSIAEYLDYYIKNREEGDV